MPVSVPTSLLGPQHSRRHTSPTLCVVSCLSSSLQLSLASYLSYAFIVVFSYQSWSPVSPVLDTSFLNLLVELFLFSLVASVLCNGPISRYFSHTTSLPVHLTAYHSFTTYLSLCCLLVIHCSLFFDVWISLACLSYPSFIFFTRSLYHLLVILLNRIVSSLSQVPICYMSQLLRYLLTIMPSSSEQLSSMMLLLLYALEFNILLLHCCALICYIMLIANLLSLYRTDPQLLRYSSSWSLTFSQNSAYPN